MPEETKTDIYIKGLNNLKRLLNQSIGNKQCYAVAAQFSGIMCGPDLGGGTYFDKLDPIEGEDIYSASEIGNAYKWADYGWEVIKSPGYDQLAVGAIIVYERLVALSDTFTTHEYYGHCGVINSLNNGKFQTYEQKAEEGEIVALYDREYKGNDTIACIIKLPQFNGNPTEFVHGQAIIE